MPVKEKFTGKGFTYLSKVAGIAVLESYISFIFVVVFGLLCNCTDKPFYGTDKP